MYKLTLVSLLVGISLSCGTDGPMSPTPPTTPPPVVITPPTIPPPSPEPPPDEEEKGCEIVQINRSGISVQTRCNGVRFHVEAEVALGDGYYNIWLPELNSGALRGPFIYGQWSKWIEWPEGTHSYRLAAETKTDSGKVYQCDRHHGDFTVKCDPKPPGCVQPESPGPNCTWNEPDCKWECTPLPCEPVGEPECPEQTWDYVLCKWVGPCTCTPPEDPVCTQYCTYDDTTCLWDCDYPTCGECQTWNPETCACEGECPPPDCVIPPEHNFSMSSSVGNPAAECGLFDLIPSGDTPVIYITKCGLFYEVTHNPWALGQCSNGQDVSHSTPCYCPEEG